MTRLDLVLTVLVKVKTWYDKVRLELVVTVLGAVNLPHRQGHFLLFKKNLFKNVQKQSILYRYGGCIVLAQNINSAGLNVSNLTTNIFS